MWIADKWKDYEVIDCSGGEKLERWGDYTLVRPTRRSSGIPQKKKKAGSIGMNTTTAAKKAAVNGSFLIYQNSGKFTMVS